jgi:electron transfer flavoprotein beta subunit
VAWVGRINEANETCLIVEQNLADSVEVVEISYPCLITVEKDIMQPRLPSYRMKLETRDRPVKVLEFKDLPDQDETRYGLKGSPTQVERIFPPEQNTDRVLWEGSVDEIADQCLQTLKRLKFV